MNKGYLLAGHTLLWDLGFGTFWDLSNYTTLMVESEEELKSLLIKVKEESEKVGLKLNT